MIFFHLNQKYFYFLDRKNFPFHALNQYNVYKNKNASLGVHEEGTEYM